MQSDPIADMLTRIRNANTALHPETRMPSSKLKEEIARILSEEGYIDGYDVVEDAKQGMLRSDLKYGPRGETVLHKLQRVARGGCRVYRGVGDLPRVLDGLGIAILSTPQGILSDRSCRERKVGGEVLCTVY